MQQRVDTTGEDRVGERLILPLHELGRRDLAIAGGKGANLGDMARAGFPVPSGFVITTAAYDRFVAAGHLVDVVNAVAAVNGTDPDRLAALREAFERTPIPPEVESAIRAAYRELGGRPVAVRSSATAEDLPEAAFAGQQDTFLNVTGGESLLDAVRRCWASLWNERAVAYRERQGLAGVAPKLAVVVQEMVAPEVAGVMFTANPVTGARDEVVIDASPGLGEAVVSGAVTPDHFVLDRGGGSREWQPGRRETVIRASAGGGTERVSGSTPQDGPVLPLPALRELAKLGTAIEAHFGGPQDIEWAWHDGRVSILQARPVTALPEPFPEPGRPMRMLAGIFAEMFPVRPYPLDMTVWLPALSTAAVEPLFSLVGVSAPTITAMISEEDGVPVRFSGQLRVRPTPALLLAPLRVLWLALRNDPNRWHADRGRIDARRRARALAERDVETLSWHDLVPLVRDALKLPLPLAGEPRRRYYPRALLAAGLLRIVLGVLGRGRSFGTLLSTGIDSETVKSNREIAALAEHVRASPPLAALFAEHEAAELQPLLLETEDGRAFQVEFAAFMKRYGHREVVLSTVLEPTWGDAPEIVLGMVQGLALAAPAGPEEKPAWEAARDSALAHPLLRPAPLRSAFAALLATARCLWVIREDTHFDATLIMPGLRRVLLELGRRLVDVGALDAPEDIFHLRFEELVRAGSSWPPDAGTVDGVRATVLRRKNRRAELESVPFVDPRLFRQAGARPGAQGEIVLRGAPGSPGQAEGPARIINGAAEFGLLRPGEILVAPYTNPAWTPLFQRAAAVVVDAGGTGSHAAIVAREYGIPAVMGTAEGTLRLVNGERVRVDGTRGLVFRSKGSAEPGG